MSPKKIHETSRLALFINTKAKEYNIEKIIDLGAGQGYLSHLLVTSFGLNVTAIEGKDHNINQSIKRATQINKVLQRDGDFDTVCKTVTGDNIHQIADQPCILIGLHTCGDLASNSLKLFMNNDNIKGIINVGCCYHHLTEYVNNDIKVKNYLNNIGESGNNRSLDETLTNNYENAGFPLSEYLRQYSSNGFFLGKISRSLCISEPSQKSLKNATKNFKKLEYRAAFQAFLTAFYPKYEKTFALGNKIRKFTNFGEYTLLALKKMNIPNDLSCNEINSYYFENFQRQEKKISIL